MSFESAPVLANQTNTSMWCAVSELIMERTDDLIYTELLVMSFFLSLIIRRIKSGVIREYLGAVIGLLLTYYFTGWKLMYSFGIVFLNILINTFVKSRYLALISFIVTFAYLGFMRAIHWFGLPPLVSHANAVQLIMTLRLVGLSFEIADFRNRNAASKNKTRLVYEPSWWQAMLYAYNFPGLFTGPYYTYAMHRDVVDNDNIMEISVWQHILWRLYNLAWALPSFLFLVYVFPLETMKKDDFYDQTAYYRIWVSFLVFIWMRCRVYSAWMVAESICVLNGIGIYPEDSAPVPGRGPVKLENYNRQMNNKGTVYNTEAVRNLDILSIEFEGTFRGGMRAWNRTVQSWLANFVYKRVPRDFGVLLTMIVSAYWHGIHPGYYLSFLTVPLCTFAEDSIMSIMSGDNKPLAFKIFWYIIRQLGFTLMASGFLLLTWKDTIRYWRSVHFHVHWIMGTVIVFSWFYKSVVLTMGARSEIKKSKQLDRGQNIDTTDTSTVNLSCKKAN